MDAAACASKLTVLCPFDPTCCICMRFALPRLEVLWEKFRSNSQCAVIAIGRGCDEAALQSFRSKCREAQANSDRHMVALTMPMAPDADQLVFEAQANSDRHMVALTMPMAPD